MTDKPLVICVCGQTPPPFHGQAVMIQLLVSGAYKHIRLVHVRMAFSRRIEDIGNFTFTKVLHLFGLAFHLAAARLRGATVLYYPPAGGVRVAIWRDIVLLLLTRWMFKKTVFHFHTIGLIEEYERSSRFIRFLIRLAYGRPDLAIYLSGYSPRDGVIMHPKSSLIIPNGIVDVWGDKHLDRSVRDPASPPVILFAGALSAEKGLLTVIEALRLLHLRHIPFQAVLVGEWRSPQFGQQVRRTLAAAGIASRVRLAGLLTGDAKRQAFAEADIFFFPSAMDNFPLVALEAMMMELPIVSSSWCGLKEIVEEGVTGFQAPFAEAPAFAEKLERLINDPERRRKMGKAGRLRFLQNYTAAIWRARMDQELGRLGEKW